ncbi:lytic murein transglycosylase [Aeromicrobium choanae]|uniref:Transglycosylase SLT domain-containing protein n=1 Tax=Aeromicrobium choanae TaxID=1736691 RepID=A0A1T4Z6H5_9ACTN|nr:lytic murein transglycosylase [Aeromicrobium choanae]SKB09589.1 Transglycosylase SLT domain-containing protein [Aeromicrobium choanae]
MQELSIGAGSALPPSVDATAQSGVDPTWVRRNADRTGIPAVAVGAYADAALALGTEQPACRLGWTTLAGIATVESDHGRHAGGTLDAQGRTTVPVIGPALDGSPGLAAIPADAASTARHGDPVWDHAVGPFQFIGSTWERWRADGDGDGVEDPHDLDDAALAAARYLCAAGQDLSTGQGWSRAIHSYNHSDEYVLAVLAAAEAVAG